MKPIPYLISFLICLFVNCSQKEFTLPNNPYANWAKTSMGLQEKTMPKKAGVWSDRVYPMDVERTKTLLEVNGIDGIEDVPSPTKDLTLWKNRLLDLHKLYPKEVNALADELVYGIYFITNLGSTGLTGIIRDKEGIPIGGIIFLDSGLLSEGGNDWATKKENSAFQKSDTRSIEVHLDNSNSLQTALSFILLHELGHILAIVKHYVPDYAETTRDFRGYPYFQGVWWSETFSPYENSFFPERPKIKFYQKNPTIPIFPDGKFLYKKLTNTQFLSLYAATNADDTFAEAFAQYIHVTVLQNEYKVYLRTNSEREMLLSEPIHKEGGRKFRELFQTILYSHSP
ncbi:hypothetical protein [Leptospira jelokensis]|uniref:hypothetical protein n=1 Tax=Leptospira jelokensis TaxID=2484931 RepID=UPI0010915AC6|nr:hypothetical protein [Leptospira jelokensis]TGM01247.1 hypothetical protein EHQ79_07290 [Leptospira jelokensis]